MPRTPPRRYRQDMAPRYKYVHVDRLPTARKSTQGKRRRGLAAISAEEAEYLLRRKIQAVKAAGPAGDVPAIDREFAAVQALEAQVWEAVSAYPPGRAGDPRPLAERTAKAYRRIASHATGVDKEIAERFARIYDRHVRQWGYKPSVWAAADRSARRIEQDLDERGTARKSIRR